MAEPIEANYLPDGNDWTVTVSGRGKTLTGTAPGLIAARDRADQLVEQLTPGEETRTVVHRLNGDAVEFTTAYLTARLAKPEQTAAPAAEQAEPDKAAAGPAEKTGNPAAKKAPKKARKAAGQEPETGKPESGKPENPPQQADTEPGEQTPKAPART